MISITVKKGRVPSCSQNQKQKKEKFKALSNHSVSFPHSISVGRSSLRGLLSCSLQEHCTISYICAWISSNHTAADHITSIHQAYIIDFFACKELVFQLSLSQKITPVAFACLAGFPCFKSIAVLYQSHPAATLGEFQFSLG